MITNKQKALFKIAKARVGMTDQEEASLLGSFGVTSCKDLDNRQFDEAMRYFRELGFTPKARKPASSKELLKKKVKALITDMGLTNRYVDAMAKHMFGVEVYGWCDAEQLHSIVAALTYHRKRNGSKRKAQS